MITGRLGKERKNLCIFCIFSLLSPIPFSKETSGNFLTEMNSLVCFFQIVMSLLNLTDFWVCHSLHNDSDHYLINITFTISKNYSRSSRGQPQFPCLPLKIPFNTSRCLSCPHSHNCHSIIPQGEQMSHSFYVVDTMFPRKF